MQLWFSLTVSRACLACSKSFTQGASLNLPRLITAVSQMQLQLHSQTVWFGVFLTRGKPRHDLSTDSRPICSETCCHTQASTVRAAPKRWKYVLLQEQSQCRDTGNGFTGCWTKVSSPTSPCARTCQCSSTIKSIGFQHWKFGSARAVWKPNSALEQNMFNHASNAPPVKRSTPPQG